MEYRIINLTQHPATTEQIADGVIDLPHDALAELRLWLTFDRLPDREQVERAAEVIATLALPHERAMIGGAPYLMAPLEAALRERGVKPVYSFTQRVSEEQPMPDGTVRKTQVFRHLGFVEA